jgi:hypothetical protein
MYHVTVCGAGNAAHVLLPVLAATQAVRIKVFAPLAEEAARWSASLGANGAVTTAMPGGQTLAGRPALVTADPEAAVVNADLVLLALPAFAHESVLAALAPHLPATAQICALPARGGFEWMARQVLPDHQGVLLGLQTLPWACRIRTWGQSAEVLGVKTGVDLAGWPPESLAQAAQQLSSLLHVAMQPVPGFLALTLANTGQLIHPGIMVGLFHDWNGRPLGEDQAPLFYGGVDDDSAALLQALSDEVQAVCAALERALPQLDLSSVLPLDIWLQRAYAGQIDDASTLRSSFTTNRAYTGLRAPLRLIEENAYVPWFEARYLSEDVPYGLLVTRGIAELAGVATPAIDRVILWAQERLGKEYLTNGRVAGRDVAESRAPQRFGIRSVQELVLM